ncbi:MAG: hypothetical protein LPH21_12920 [Shewanella sp.]|nr:hypothetical protein [Shewanella sp.]
MDFKIQLGSVELSKHMVWANQYQYSKVRQTFDETLGGGIHIHADVVEAGRPIILTSQESGWLTRSMVEQLQLMSDTPGAQFELIMGDYSFMVMFAHHAGNAFAYEPKSFKLDGDATDWFVGSINLITV